MCKNRLGKITSTNFVKAAAFMLVAWWAVPVLVWVSRPMIESAGPYGFQEQLGYILLYSPLFLLLLVLSGTAVFLLDGFGHRKFTGVSPKGFYIFIFASVLGLCTSTTGIAMLVRML